MAVFVGPSVKSSKIQRGANGENGGQNSSLVLKVVVVVVVVVVVINVDFSKVPGIFLPQVYGYAHIFSFEMEKKKYMGSYRPQDPDIPLLASLNHVLSGKKDKCVKKGISG